MAGTDETLRNNILESAYKLNDFESNEGGIKASSLTSVAGLCGSFVCVSECIV